MKRVMTPHLRRVLLGGFAVLCAMLNSELLAAPSTYLDVCTSGCAYTSVQDAIDDISDSGAAKPYTIFIESGVLSSDTSTTTNGKDYINFIGRGEGVSVWQATADWFSNAADTSTGSDFLNLADSSHITIANLTIDARTNDPGGLTPLGGALGAVRMEDSDRILLESAEIRGANWGFWEYTGVAGNLIEVFNSKIIATATAAEAYNSTWHIYGSEIKAVQTGNESSNDQAVALVCYQGINTTIWGSHLHAESSASGAAGIVAALQVKSATGGSMLAVIGTQLHVKMTTASVGSSGRVMLGFYLQTIAGGGGTKEFDFIGSYLNYESPASLSQGRLGGIGYNFSNSGSTVNFVGGGIFDVGGSGGSYRADVIQNSGVIGSAPAILFSGAKVGAAVAVSGSLPSGLGKGHSTLTTQRGSVTLSSGTAGVTFPTALPDASYSVTVSSGANETLAVTGKSTTGFTVTSSNGGSSSTVDWILVR